jgi:hypothetical protein
VCEPKSILAESRYLDALFPIRPARGGVVEHLERAIAGFGPDLILPMDESATLLLWRYCQTGKQAASSPGNARLYELMHKTKLGAHARRLNIAAPAQTEVRSLEEAQRFSESNGYPVVCKRDLSGGGTGVRIFRNPGELSEGFASVPDSPRASSAGIVIQKYVSGKPCFYTCVAYKGKLLGGYGAEVKATQSDQEQAPSTVVTLKRDAPEMGRVAETVLRDLDYTGFACLDFIRESKTGTLQFLELNVRPNRVGHLGHRVGVDLFVALSKELGQSGAVDGGEAPSEATVALFPYELQRDPGSAYLKAGLHDVPWDDLPVLIALLSRIVKRRQDLSERLSRALDELR